MTALPSFLAALWRIGTGVLASAALVVCGAAQSAPLRQAGDGPQDGFVRPSDTYHGHAEVCALVDAWVAADERVEAVHLGVTREGRVIPAFRFAGRVGSAQQRRTVLLVGGLDGRSQAGSEAVLWGAWELLGQLDHLPADLSFIALPWGSPDGLARTHGGRELSGRNAAPVDDDGDGRLDEDAADDLDGDGMTLDMVIPDPENGRWCFSEDHRFLVPAAPGDAPRYALMREGRDDDLDGFFNEDGAGGVDLNAQFPIGWQSPRQQHDHSGEQLGCGSWPLSEPVSRRIADLCLQEKLALCVSFVGTHGGLFFGRGFDSNRTVSKEVEDRVRLAFERVTGRMGCQKRMERSASGRLVDWLGARGSCIALEVAVWGPDVVGVDGRPFQARAQRLASQLDRSVDALDTGRPLGEIDAAWAFWLDEIQGGAGFQDWHPVDLGGGRTGWVGGWEPRTRWNPPVSCLKPSLEGLPRFVHELAMGLPRIELDVLAVKRMGDLVQIDAQVTNRGGLETNLVGSKRAGLVTVSLERVDPEDVVAGAPSTKLEALGPDESSKTLRWLIRARPGVAIQIHARTESSPMVIREVRP